MGAFEPMGVTKSFRSGGGEVSLWFPGGDMVAARVQGHVRSGLARAAFGELDHYALAQEHPGRGFIDFSEMTEFDWEARMTLVRWNVANRRKAQRLDLLTQSWAIHLALRSLATILGERLVSHENRVTFESAYSTALTQRSNPRIRAQA
jgi:hypothetical protein